ncbi:MAG: hypothetical protein R3Y47_01090 [Lachnospiraceae bacterium]
MKYNYLLHVSPASNIEYSQIQIEYIQDACVKVNSTKNSIRYCRKFTYEGLINKNTFALRLQTTTAVVPTRTISSITRYLLKNYPPETFTNLLYNGSILSASLTEEFHQGSRASYLNLAPHEIVSSVVEVFFGQDTLNNKQKEAARIASSKIQDIIADYKSSV